MSGVNGLLQKDIGDQFEVIVSNEHVLPSLDNLFGGNRYVAINVLAYLLSTIGEGVATHCPGRAVTTRATHTVSTNSRMSTHKNKISASQI